MEALKSVLEDDSFKIKSLEAIEAREVAQKLLDWCLSENTIHFHKICFEIVERTSAGHEFL